MIGLLKPIDKFEDIGYFSFCVLDLGELEVSFDGFKVSKLEDE